MKNETLEELGRFAERKYLERLNNYENCDFSNGLIEGAKWQAEKIHNDVKVFTEELKDKIDSFEFCVNENSYISDYIEEWFEKFKKDNL